MAGVSPFAPTFDTVGILAQHVDVLQQAAAMLLPGGVPSGGERPTIYLLEDAFALADPEVRRVLQTSVEPLRALFDRAVRTISLKEICGDGSGSRWGNVARHVLRVAVERDRQHAGGVDIQDQMCTS